MLARLAPRPDGPATKSSPPASTWTALMHWVFAVELDGRWGHPPRPVSRIGGNESFNATAPPPLPPPPNRSSTELVLAARGAWPGRLRVPENKQAIPRPRSILRPDLHLAESDHGPPFGVASLDVWLPSKAKEVNLE